jgi:diguanylate cyclase (GGDEF)-like protein
VVLVDDFSVLVVDDMQFSRTVVASALQGSGCSDVRLAENAAEALELLGERTADVVLVDWVMPGMDGLELLEAIRQMDERSQRYTAVIMFTGKEGDEAMMEAFAHGVDDYLRKPFNDTELIARVYAAGRMAALQNTLLETANAMEAENEQLRRINAIDPITRMGNRRYAVERLEVLLRQVSTRNGALSFSLVDIDGLAHINERYGYEAGDEVLRTVGQRLRRSVRPLDDVARWGGGCFAVLMYYTSAPRSPSAAVARLLNVINRRGIETSSTRLPVTVSIGAVSLAHGETPISGTALLGKAEENLMLAKSQGRNRMILN